MPTFDEIKSKLGATPKQNHAVPDHGLPEPKEHPTTIPQPYAPPVATPVASEYQGTAVDSRPFPKNAILSHVEGSQWYPNYYYEQLLNADNNPEPYSVHLPPVSQQYLRIEKPEFRVQTPLTRSFNQGENEYSVTGSSIVYAFTPNVHDVFVADVGDGHLGRFNITSVSPTSYLMTPVYEIEYKLINYLDQATQTDLDLKTIERRFYVRDQFNRQRPAVLLGQDYGYYQDLLKVQATLPKEYYRDFFNREFQTLLVPDQITTVYDPFVVPFFKELLDADHHPWVYRINELNVDLGNAKEVYTLWDAAYETDISVLDRCYTNLQPVDVSWFRGQAMYANISYSGIDTAMFPVGIQTSTGAVNNTVKSSFKLTLGPNLVLNRPIGPGDYYSPHTMDLGPQTPEDIPHPVPWISPDIFEDTYVFSKAFYTDSPRQYGLETMFRQAIKGEYIDPGRLLKACHDRVLWTSVTRFYYIPVLLYILRVALVKVS